MDIFKLFQDKNTLSFLMWNYICGLDPLEVKWEAQSMHTFVILIDTAKFFFLYISAKAVGPDIILCLFISFRNAQSGLPIKE